MSFGHEVTFSRKTSADGCYGSVACLPKRCLLCRPELSDKFTAEVGSRCRGGSAWGITSSRTRQWWRRSAFESSWRRWPLLTEKALRDAQLQGHFDARVWQVHISESFCINSLARNWVTKACCESQCQACQAERRRARGMMADATWCQYNSLSNWYHKFCSYRRQPEGYIYTVCVCVCTFIFVQCESA